MGKNSKDGGLPPGIPRTTSWGGNISSGSSDSWWVLVSDLLVALLFVAYVLVFLGINGYMILTPVLLGEESFGQLGKDQQETQGNIARTSGLLHIPNGVTNIFSSLVLFGPVTRRFGEAKTVLLSGACGSLAQFFSGLFAYRVWHLGLLNALSGLSFGLLMPAIGPLMARHASARFPRQQAQAQGIPMLGLSVGTAIGQPIVAVFHSYWGRRVGWVFSTCCLFAFIVLVVVSMVLVDGYEATAAVASKQEKDSMARTGEEGDEGEEEEQDKKKIR